MKPSRLRFLLPWHNVIFWMAITAFTLFGIAWHIASGPSFRADRTPSFLDELFVRQPPTDFSRAKRVPDPVADSRVLTTGKDGIVIMPELVTLATQLNAPEATIQDDLEILQTLIETFHRSNAVGPPTGGENQEVAAQLRGINSQHLAVIAPDHPSINEQGQLLDRWTTPFYFHPVSNNALEIRSAGPDKILFTGDDVTN